MAGSSHGFSLPSLERKLKDLSTTLQSIQGVSQWLIHYRKHAKTIVSVWYKELQKADSSHKLTLLYVANDVIQNSKKKGTEYRVEFLKVLPRALQIISKTKDSSLVMSVERIVSVWEERHVFENEALSKFKTVLVSGSTHPHRRTRSESDLKRVTVPDAKRIKVASDKAESPVLEGPPNNRKAPEAESMLQRMLAIEADKSVANDMTTRQKIASFPPEIYDPDILSKIKDKTAAEQLAEKVEEASKVLKGYNTKLEAELKERKEIQEDLDAFTFQQRRLLKEAKRKLKEHQGKLEKVTNVREELKSHLANLPDFTKLPMGSDATLAPLPSVGDLFN